MELLTNSRFSCARSCLRKHFYAYEKCIRPAIISEALGIGTAVHAGIEAYSTTAGTFEERQLAAINKVTSLYDPVPSNIQDLNDWAIQRVKSERLVHAYLSRYQNDEYKIIAAEKVFELPLINPETGSSSRTFALAGKIDAIIELPDGRLAVKETKTSGDDIRLGTDYWQKWRLDSQISLYFYAARKLGFNVQCVLIDAIGKPLIRQGKATPAESRKYTKAGVLYAGQREVDETPDEFANRYSESLAAEPERFFVRSEIPRLDADIEEAQYEWRQQAQLLHDCQKHGRWFRNTQSCLHPYPCAYRNICWNNIDVKESTPDGFIKVENAHQELV